MSSAISSINPLTNVVALSNVGDELTSNNQTLNSESIRKSKPNNSNALGNSFICSYDAVKTSNAICLNCFSKFSFRFSLILYYTYS
jgi:hypothetical protein